jgi:hypothetical protein
LGFIFGAAFLACISFAVIQGETSGYTASWIVALFVACGISGIAFIITEKKVKSPMLDLSMFRLPPFAGSNFVAFVAYFGTFSIFFFTALYLQVVADASAYQTAVDFLPMAAGLIIVSALTGPLVARVGPRWPMAFGCLLAGGGILVANAVLSPTVDFATLGWVLPLAGIGIGMLLVPVTSVPLTVVPPERSGMAASATNTSREMGAVFGVAILGSIVNAKLTGDLAARLKAIGIPPNFQSLVEHAIQTGGASQGGAATTAEHNKNAAVAKIATKVVNAAYDAFGSGLHEALLLSGCLILAGAVVAVLTIHRKPGETFELGTEGGRAVPRPHSGSQEERIGDLQHPLVREDRDVRGAHGRHGAVELASERSRSDTDAVADGKRPRHEKHESREDVAEALLGCDAEDDSRVGTAQEQMADRDRQHGEHAQQRNRVPGPVTSMRMAEPAVWPPRQGARASSSTALARAQSTTRTRNTRAGMSSSALPARVCAWRGTTDEPTTRAMAAPHPVTTALRNRGRRARTRVGCATAIRFWGCSLTGSPSGLHASCPRTIGQHQGR